MAQPELSPKYQDMVLREMFLSGRLSQFVYTRLGTDSPFENTLTRAHPEIIRTASNLANKLSQNAEDARDTATTININNLRVSALSEESMSLKKEYENAWEQYATEELRKSVQEAMRNNAETAQRFLDRLGIKQSQSI